MIENPIGFVGRSGKRSLVLYINGQQIEMTCEQSIDLAVRLVALADDLENPTFGKTLREFMNT